MSDRWRHKRAGRALEKTSPGDPRYQIPRDCNVLNNHRISHNVSYETAKARREFTDFFHAPGCYDETLNLSCPEEHMSDVNQKFYFEIRRYLMPQPVHPSFFRVTVGPVKPECNDFAQDWTFQPLDKYKPQPAKSMTARLELMSPLPRTPAPVTLESAFGHNMAPATIFVRSTTSREPLKDFLATLEMAQEGRTKQIAKKLTWVTPAGTAHAELLVDAAIDKKILKARVDAIEPLSDFWKLPLELRSRVYEIACGAWGQLRPQRILPYDESFRNHIEGQRDCGRFIVQLTGLILPKRVRGIFPSLLSSLMRPDSFEQLPSDHEEGIEDDRRSVLIPALLTSNRQVREEAIKVIYVQPEFRFSSVSCLHEFISGLRNDSLESLRKVNVRMPVVDTLILFSLARKCLSFDEAAAVYRLFKKRRITHGERLLHFRLKRYLEERWEENDKVFERAHMMRFTHLTVDPLWDDTGLRSHREMTVRSQAHFELEDFAVPDHQIQTFRLLLVKLVNLTLDIWENMGVDRPQLRIVWPESIAERELVELEAMNQHYRTEEIDFSEV
ncbi:hypothetical protein NA57DRAFT_70458 [Rhizodiscina lignyota]|uniref:Uncharacterized protein n=1 Tax=Rhizodiscina lignyota TaxID=1504668 RepID=A0A9P4IQH5_9PEZI|nr:hypothetical protein NA57DRAFT_70458 [Rhizodiscina lignyota]